MKILANDGISESGKATLENAGFEVIITKVAQEQLENFINEDEINVIIIKNNTEIHAELIDNCPSLKLIANAGTNNDNIDVMYAQECGVQVVNIADASANAIAELVFAHLLGMARFLHQANREMPLEGDMSFNAMKKQFSNGTELRGKTLGIVGMDAAGQQVAKLALGVGMKVVAYDVDYDNSIIIPIDFFNGQNIDIEIDMLSSDELFKEAHFISLHLSAQENHLISTKEFEQMKDGAVIVDVSIDRGGCFETSKITTHSKPTFTQHGVIHYCVPNIPSRYARTASVSISNIFTPYLLNIAEEGGFENAARFDKSLRNGMYFYHGILTNKTVADWFDLPYNDINLLIL